jgi:fibro-slime domain-containing protein
MVSRHSFGQMPSVLCRSSWIRVRFATCAAVVSGALGCSTPGGTEGAGGVTGGATGTGGSSAYVNVNTGGVGYIPGSTGGQATGGATHEATTIPAPVCGNGAQEQGEACDDHNTDSGDGCSADCSAIEQDYVCPNPGQLCVLAVVCGDKKISGAETCDDSNTTPGDGCSDSCQVEPGWDCPIVGAACRAAHCGDGIIAGTEVCDDGSDASGDGCSSTCRLEFGWICSAAGEACTPTVCGDNVTEGSEECDDGNLIPYDGCSPTCTFEPQCANGTCTAVCGDGLKFPQEGCDDGNTRAGDGCSADCQVEDGYACTDSSQAPPTSLDIPILYRDFLYYGTPEQSGHPAGHQDFENAAYAPPASCRASVGLVAQQLGADGKPVFKASQDTTTPNTTCPVQITSADSFASWYCDDPLNKVVAGTLTLNQQAGTTTYVFDSATDQPYRGLGGFFPLTGLGWQTADYCSGASPATADCQTNIPSPNTVGTPPWCTQWSSQCSTYGTPPLKVESNNFSFTSELRYPFTYQGGEVFSFTGDDDVWAFVNGVLAVDLGGIHIASSKSITLDATTEGTFGLTVGGMYEIALFQAERHVSQSNYKLTLAGFDHTTSVCQSICGDGIVTPDEACDLGTDGNTGAYGTCSTDCTLPPYCGDGHVDDADGEQCDDGVNLATYGYNHNAAACGPNCQLAGYCGDGKVDSLFGEQCDDGNQIPHDDCEPNCMIGDKCGNGKPDPGEDCDDGNTRSGDGCSEFCFAEAHIG